MKRAVIIACLASIAIAAGALAADDSTNAPPMMPHRPMFGNLLPPRVLGQLALTADQQTKYDALDASFKSDVAKWRAENAPSSGTTTNAVPPSGGRQALRALRKSYIEKLRAFLTADQNAKLTEIIENGPGRGRRGAGEGTGTNSPPQTPPSQNN
jgi:Spy/CpxP family protein refolding chaperone